MARKTTPAPPPRSASLSPDEMRAGIERLSKRVADLDAFSVDAMQTGNPPELRALEASIARTLERTFGLGTTDYRRYHGASSLSYYAVTIMGQGPSLGEYRNHTRQSIADAKALLAEAIRGLEEELSETASPALAETKSIRPAELSRRVFVVHGHDEGARESLARFLEKLGFEAIILHEKASGGKTVIEKVEAHSEVDFAVVLLTPDDVGGERADTLQPRARQNVLLELGYFIGKLGRHNVCALRKGNVEVPSDFSGVVYIDLDAHGAWKQGLAKELDGAGHVVDWNIVMRA